MPIYAFRCSCGNCFDQRVAYGETSVCCPLCALPAVKESVYRLNFGGFAETPRDQRTYHQEFKDFTEAGAELEYKHQRLEEAVGATVPTPRLATIAKTQAKELRRKGVKNSEDWKQRLKH